ncbi:folylpolyglutamate synthase, partial [Candidatus Magnetoovum chiemensis]
TNIINPDVTIITNISMDHTAFLGDSLDKIAKEKAGIIKSGIPVITTSQEDAAMEEIKKKSFGSGCPFYEYGKDFQTHIKTQSVNGIVFDYKGDSLLSDLTIPLTSTLQTENIACAIKAYEILLLMKGLTLKGKKNIVANALSNLAPPARTELTTYKGMKMLFRRQAL